MKILHIVWSAQYGGAETMLVDILNYQVKSHQIGLLIINDSINELIRDFDPRIKIIMIKRPLKSRNLWYLLKLNGLLLFNSYDIIHCHQDNIIRYVPVYKWKKNFCLTVHSVEMDIISLPKYNYIFSISDIVYKKLKEERLDSMLVINGIDINNFKIKTSDLNSKNIFKLVQISRLEYLHKGQDILLKAIRILLDKYQFNQFHLDFIGDGSSLEYLKLLTDELKLNSYVSFLGSKSKYYIKTHLCEYDLLIQPSNWEGFGLTAIEAMAAKVPTMVSDVDGLKSNAQGGKNAFTFEPGNVDDCAKTLYHTFTCPKEEIEEMVNNAYQYVIENFDVSRTAQDYLNHYEQIFKEITHE